MRSDNSDCFQEDEIDEEATWNFASQAINNTTKSLRL